MANNHSEPQANFTKIDKLVAQIEKDPRSKDFIPLAEEYVRAGMLPEAALALEDGLKVYPSFVTALVKLGGVYLQLQERIKAQNRLEEAINNSPDNILAHRMLAKIHVLNNNLELASQSCEKVLYENPYDKEMLKLKLEIEKAGDHSLENEFNHTSPMETAVESTSTPQDSFSSQPPEHSSDILSSEQAMTVSSPISESDHDFTPDHTQQYIKKLSQLLERIQDRRVA